MATSPIRTAQECIPEHLPGFRPCGIRISRQFSPDSQDVWNASFLSGVEWGL